MERDTSDTVGGEQTDAEQSALESTEAQDIDRRSLSPALAPPGSEKDQDSARPWYEGLTPQERADAKRRYKNRKGVERWRRRKQVQRAKGKEGEAAQSQAQEQEQAEASKAEPSSAGPSKASQQTVDAGREDLPKQKQLEQGKPEPQQQFGQGKPETQKQLEQGNPEAQRQEPRREGPSVASGSQGSQSKGSSKGSKGPNGSSSDPSTDEFVIPEWTQPDRMLHEFGKLGKENEAKMKALLDTLASYAMIPHGFQRHKGRIVRLAEGVLDVARNGAPSTNDVAQRFLSWGIRFNKAWEDPEIPNFQQIMNVFAKGSDDTTFVEVGMQDGSRRNVSLRQLSRFDETVHKELYVGLIHLILQEMPMAVQKNQGAYRAKARISKHMKQASMIASGYVIGQFVSFTTQRAIRKNVAVPMQGMMYAAASLGLRHESCNRLWQVWDAAKANLEPLVEKHHHLEQNLDRLLVLHDISKDGSYHAIFSAVEQLMQNFEEQFDVSYYADLKCSHELLTPLQVGLLAAAQVPKLPIRQMQVENIDPYTRISVVFESGVVPRYQ